jgi:hypothetical protein
MYISGQNFTNSVLDRIRQTVSNEPSISRLALSRRVCGWLNWVSPGGSPQEVSCRKALNKLDAAAVIDLPERSVDYSFGHKSVTSIALDIPDIQGTLQDLGEVKVYPVSSRYAKESKVWFAFFERYHYLGNGNLCGAQIRYLVKSSAGYLGALAFSAASWSLKDRDNYIGWQEGARRVHLQQLICNSRFLILPTVKVPNLASHVLSLALARVADDWEKRYHIRPVLVETFVASQFTGACYKAANFTYVGKSAGRRDGTQKNIFLYPLCRKWRDILCKEPAVAMPRPENPRHWAEEEFGTIRLYDERLKERLYTIAQDFYSSPEATIPEACASKVRTIAAYRFFQNPRINMDMILAPHLEATVERIRQHKIVLVPQDTTALTYTLPMTEGLGPINNKTDKAIGLILHDTLAFTEQGTPLGLVDAQVWARDPEDIGKSDRRKELPIEDKESVKWLKSYRKAAEIQKLCPETMLISMGDRESDIYELFLEAAKEPGPGLLIRSERSRNRKVDQEFLWDFMAGRQPAGSLKIHIPHSGSRQARNALLDIRFAEVELRPPKIYSQTVKVWAVYALERDAKDKAIEWMLITTVPVENFADAQKRVEWYSGRWGIEVFHRTLKSGCRVKDRQLETADRLGKCLALDMVVAWRIYYLTMLGRETPDASCTVFFKDIEWKALCCYVSKKPIPPDTPPTMRQAIFMVAAIGGHLGRKGDGFPGTQTIWRGLARLYRAADMYAIITQQLYLNPMQSGP